MGDSATRVDGAAPAGAIELHAGALRLALRADLGGSIAGFWHGDTPILRSTDSDSLSGSRRSACYPLVPYSNRLGNKRFRWQGRDYTTETNFDDNPHSVHGVGWLRPWDVLSHSAAAAVLRYSHIPDAHWPFSFDTQQHFTLDPSALHVRMAITNTADMAQPVGLGWHPYFPKRRGSGLSIDVSDRWESDASELPVRKVAHSGIDGAVANLRLDHCFEGWKGAARIRDEKFSLGLTSNVKRLVVYTPTDKAYFCVEPVSHVSNAIQMIDPCANGLRELQPGESFEASMTVEVSAL